MSLEQTIRKQKLQESADLAARLDQLVRAGLMPSQNITTLKTSLSKMQSGITLHGKEVAVLNDLINSMLFIVLGDDAIFSKARVGAKATYQQTHEAKEKTEYDYEGDMAMGQLKSIIANSQRMHDMLSDDTNLPEWVQSKITLAEDYISTASNYMQGEMSEELKGNQHKIDANKNGKVDAHDFHLLRKKKKVAEEVDLDEGRMKDIAMDINSLSHEDFKKKHKKTKKEMQSSLKSEEVEGLDELKRETVRTYYNKAIAQGKPIADKMKMVGGDFSSDGSDTKTLRKRGAGVKMALRRRSGEVKMSEDVEQVDEVSKATMGRYINKAKDSIDNTSYRSGIKDGTAISSSTPYKSNNPLEKKLTKRHKGISMAVKKLTKEDIDAVKSMNESYKTAFNTALIEYNIKSPSELGESKRKEFFNYVDLEFKKGEN